MSIACSKWQEKISLWLDGELIQGEAEELKSHIWSCPSCRANLEAMRQMDMMLSAAPEVSPAPGFTARFQDRLVERRPRRRFGWMGIVVLLLSAVGLSLMVMLVLAVAGLTLSQVFPFREVLASGFQAITVIIGAAGTVINAMLLFAKAFFRGIYHPVVISYAAGTMILFVLWAWIVKGSAKLAQGASS